MMLFHTDGKSLQSHLRTFSVLVLHLLLTHFSRGQSELIGSSQPIVALLGDDIILPCHLEPAENAAGLTLEWTRSDLNPRFVHVLRSGEELVGKKHKSFEGRTSLFIDELKVGNISLKLSKVKLTDHGTYRCFIPALERQSLVQLVVASTAVCSPVVTLAGIEATSGVILNCESKGWHPKPEVLWLDGEGKLLSAGPTETVRGPDDLFTVSSRVTVERRHSNIICRVQQKNINQTRETQIHVPDDFQSSSSPIIIGLALCTLIPLILLLVFFVWRLNKNKTKKKHKDGNYKDEKKKRSKSNKTEDQFVTEEEREREQLMTDGTVQMEVLGEGDKKTTHSEDNLSVANKQKLHAEQQREEGHKEEVETNSTQGGKAAVNQMKTQNEETGVENNQTEGNQAASAQSSWFLWPLWKSDKQQRREEANKKLESLEEFEDKERAADMKWRKTNEELKEANRQLENKDEEISQLKRHVDSLMVDVQKLKDENQRSENDRQQLQNDLDTKKKEFEEKERAADMKWRKTNEELKEKDAEISQLKTEKVIQEEQQGAEKLLKKNSELEKKLKEETKKREEAEKEVKTLKKKWEKQVKKEKTKKKPETKVETSKHEVQGHDGASSANHSPNTGPLIELNPSRKTICLRSSSHEDQQLGGWKLKIQVNNEEPIIYTFDHSVILWAGMTFTLSDHGHGNHFHLPDRVWDDLKSWRTGDKLQVVLISDTEEIKTQFKVVQT